MESAEKVIPKGKFGLEIGIGTARFAEKLSIDRGLDPSEKMVRIAKERGIQTKIGRAEQIPFEDNHFDYATFHSPEEITGLLKKAGFGEFEYRQTLITASETEVEEPLKGYGEGGFVVLKAHLQ
ncbi:MAG: class I SAM-dependent methyltransferase [Balneolaceae bacterium]|nr:MAG: class I SAM-dependent methyltransferase [Balneolaceae bacterium]